MDTDVDEGPSLAALARRARNVMFAAHALQHLLTLSLPPVLLFIHSELDLSWTQLGIIIAVASITGGLAQFPSGLLVDRFGVKRVLAAGFLFTLTGLFLFSRSSTMFMFIVSQVILGLGNSTFHPASFAETSRAGAHSGRLSMVLALHSIGGNVGTAAAYSVAAVLATYLGWRGALQVLVGLGSVLAAWFFLSYREMPDADPASAEMQPEEDGEQLPEKRGRRRPALALWLPVVVISTAGFLSGSFGSGFSAFLPTLLASLQQATPAVAGILSTIMLLSGSGGSFVGGLAGDRYDRALVILVSAVTTVSLIGVLLGVKLDVLPLILLLIGLGFCQSLARPCINALTSGVSPEGRTGSVFGLVFGIRSLGGSISAPVVGFLADQYSLQVGVAVISVFFLAFGLLIFSFRKVIQAPDPS